MLVWPNRAEVDRAVRTWAVRAADAHPELIKVGYFGSYGRGDWGVGSDVDVVAIVSATDGTWETRTVSWDLRGLPVPADLLIYSQAEWDRLLRNDTRFARTLSREVIWIYDASPSHEHGAG